MRRALIIILVLAMGVSGGMFLLSSCGSSGGGGDSVLSLGAVEPWYPVNGADWNDYVKNDSVSIYMASDTASTGTEFGNYSVVIHGGEMRSVMVTGISACGGITATDAHGAFDWACFETGGVVSMVSTGLDEDTGLSDLINFSTGQWRENRVTVYENGVLYGRSISSVWWSNSIVEDNDGGSVNSEGTIYIVTSDSGMNYWIGGDKVGFVVEPGLSISGEGGGTSLVNTSNDFVWIEGSFDPGANNNSQGISLNTSQFSVVHKVQIAGGYGTGLRLSDSSGNRLDDISVSGCGMSGIYLGSSSPDNILYRIRSADNEENGIGIVGSDRNLVARAMFYSNGMNGIYDNGSADSVFGMVTVAGSAYRGFWNNGSNNLVISNMLGVNGGSFGLNFNSASSHTLAASAFINYDYGLYFGGDSSNNTMVDVVLADNGYGAHLDTATLNNSFNSVLKVGNTLDCRAPTVSGSGLMTATGAGACIIDTTISTASLVEAVTGAGSFAGKIITDDTSNLSDASGAALYGSITDWTSFDTDYRTWGLDGSVFPNEDHAGRAGSPDDPCRIWDWSLASGDTGDGGGPVLLDELALPSGADTLSHEWSDASVSVFLKNALEIPFDGRGNDNGLCESGEWCLYTPNIGDYQGHGSLTVAGSLGTGGDIENVTLLEYANNGY